MKHKHEYEPVKHEYRVDGVIVPSTTGIVDMTHSSFADIGQATLDYAARRGSDIHSATEQMDCGIDLEEIDEYDIETQPYLRAWALFKRDYDPDFQFIEKQVYYDGDLPYGGTIDRLAYIDGRMYIIDIKTTSSSSRENKVAWSLQLAAYSDALESMGITVGMTEGLIVKLKKDGTYTLYKRSEMEHDIGFSAFLTFHKLREIFKIVKGY